MMNKVTRRREPDDFSYRRAAAADEISTDLGARRARSLGLCAIAELIVCVCFPCLLVYGVC